jgi:hypothetical protein
LLAGTNKRKRATAYPNAPSVLTPLQPINFAFAAPLSIVLWQLTPAGTAVTGASVVIDDALIGCDGIDYGGNTNQVRLLALCDG